MLLPTLLTLPLPLPLPLSLPLSLRLPAPPAAASGVKEWGDWPKTAELWGERAKLIVGSSPGEREGSVTLRCGEFDEEWCMQ